jgi:two-component system sensor histidine kinase DegS
MREQEREIISCEIHDGACQYMAAAQIAMDCFRCENGPGPSVEWGSFDLGMKYLRLAVEELRRLAGGLRPVHLAVGSLPKAIESVLQELKAAGGPDIEFYHDLQADQISPRLELAMYRIVQEAVANACRHSKSTRVLVGLTQDDNYLFIQIQDWGIGFDAEGIPPGHLGLDGIRRRAGLLGGTTTIHSELGKGTLLTVELPRTA